MSQPRRGVAHQDLTGILLNVWRDELGLLVAPEADVFRAPSSANDVDEVISLQLDNRIWRLYVELKPRAPSALDLRELEVRADAISEADPSGVFCLVAPRLLQRHRLILREAGLSHADLQGVLYLRAPGLLIDIDRRLPSKDQPALASAVAQQTADPFADRTSRIVRTLLNRPRETFKVTELSDLTGISAGWVSIVSNELCRRGYAGRSKQGVHLGDAVHLLQDWARIYAWDQNPVQRFEVSYSAEEILRKLKRLRTKELDDDTGQFALTLHSAANLIAPHVRSDVVTVYADRQARKRLRSWLATELHAQPLQTGGGFQLVTPFYERSVFYGLRFADALPIVSLPQLYLDLAHYAVRGREAASVLARTAIAEELDLSAKDRSRLARGIE